VSKFVEKSYSNTKGILKLVDHYVNVAVGVSDEGVTANADGKKIVPAGTIVGGGFLTDDAVYAKKTNGAGAEGVLFYDVDVTYGVASGAVLVHGFVDLAKLPEAPTAEAVAALKQVTFLK